MTRCPPSTTGICARILLKPCTRRARPAIPTASCIWSATSWSSSVSLRADPPRRDPRDPQRARSLSPTAPSSPTSTPSAPWSSRSSRTGVCSWSRSVTGTRDSPRARVSRSSPTPPMARHHPAAQGLRPHLRARDRQPARQLGLRRAAHRRGRVRLEADLMRLGVHVGDFWPSIPVPRSPRTASSTRATSTTRPGRGPARRRSRRCDAGIELPVDCHPLFTISEEVGSGASARAAQDVAEMLTIDNGTTAPGQNSSEFGVTIAWPTERALRLPPDPSHHPSVPGVRIAAPARRLQVLSFRQRRGPRGGQRSAHARW
jgi:hypothetical protein